MKTSELIKQLQELVAEHGDLDVKIHYGDQKEILDVESVDEFVAPAWHEIWISVY
jgi:hypothetical protein